jgi:hypothetical protein
MTEETNIREIERYCNNYFNPQNRPDSAERNHPPEFLELAARILTFRQNKYRQPTDIISENVIGFHQYSKATVNGVPATWHSIFAAELAAYKRAKFL